MTAEDVVNARMDEQEYQASFNIHYKSGNIQRISLQAEMKKICHSRTKENLRTEVFQLCFKTKDLFLTLLRIADSQTLRMPDLNPSHCTVKCLKFEGFYSNLKQKHVTDFICLNQLSYLTYFYSKMIATASPKR